MERLEKWFNDKFSMEQKAIEFIRGERDKNISWSEIIENECFHCDKALRETKDYDIMNNIYVLSMVAYELHHRLYLLEKEKS